MGLQGALDRARELFERQSWGAAYAVLHGADQASQLDPADLERLAIASYLTGHDSEAGAAWSRATREYAGGQDYDSSPLQRRLRDIHTLTQHFGVKLDTFTLAGAVLAGQQVDTGFL